jgi:hypothetical protein
VGAVSPKPSKTTTVGFEDVNVGGRTVRTVHMRYEIITRTRTAGRSSRTAG